jgi:anthranilate synthase component 1
MRSPFDIPADLDTPVSAFLKLAPFRPTFLLESVEGGTRLGRYSFIGLGAGNELRIEEGGVRLAGEIRPAPGDREGLLALLREALDRAPRPEPAIPDVPFRGGLVGVAGYDLVRFLERIPSRAPSSKQFPLAAFVSPSSVLVFDHLTRGVALLHDGREDERESLKREIVRTLRGPTPDGTGGGGHESPTPGMDPGTFTDSVERVQRHIRDGDVFQLVLSIRFSGSCGVHPFQVYRALRLLNPSPYMFYLDLPGLQVVGSSPEALVRLEGRRASLRPIAGTRPRGANGDESRRLREELESDPKEAAEHVMLVDLARNDLGRVAVPGTIRVAPFRTVESYSHVMHLVSGVTGVLSPEADAFDLFAAAFPAGTVVGAPKIRAMEIIEELEPARRDLYAGSVGYFGHGGSLDQAIAIRTLVFGQETYSYQAGAGIVADSMPDREHAEVLAKSAALRAALELAEEL